MQFMNRENTDETAAGKPSRDDHAKQAALAEANSFSSDEEGAVAFILRCGFADARLRAAEHVYGRTHMEQILQSMRKIDRRVAKLMQNRIDAIVKSELIARHAQDCIAEARHLLNETRLVPNRVAELDRKWRSIGEASEHDRADFDALRAEMDARLAAQTTLQRNVIDAMESLRKMEVAGDGVSLAEARQRIDNLAQKISQSAAAPDAASLPRNLLSDFDALLQQQLSRLAEMERAEAEQAVLAEVAPAGRASLPAAVAPVPDWQSKFDDALDVMERALREGALQLAAAQDDLLRALSAQQRRIGAPRADRLTALRTDLRRLQGWAKWSGKISREELVRSVEELPQRKLPIAELAKQVATARERWKSLDAASGPAARTLWGKFDAACTTAYAPVAEHSRKQALERQKNGEKAQMLLSELRSFAASVGFGDGESQTITPDWKQVADRVRAFRQTWLRLGPMDRKDKKRLEKEWQAALRQLETLLAARTKEEVTQRESLIREAEQVDVNDRKSMDRIRLLQQQWQQSAKRLPLERKDEQALWQRFRQACDLVYAQRRDANALADGQRQQNAQARNALIASLTSALDESEDSLRKRLREAETAWVRLGPVPRADEKGIEARYRKAVSALQKKLEAIGRESKRAQRRAFGEKMALCRAVESAAVAGLPIDGEMDWSRWPVLPVPYEKLLRKRFEAAQHAVASGDAAYVDLLVRNREVLLHELLRLELMAGVDSPAEWAAQRKQAQIEALRNSLLGQKGDSAQSRIESLCALPALADDKTVTRIDRVLQALLP